MNTNADPLVQFANERDQTIASYGGDAELTTLTNQWRASSMKKRYVYNFDWMGRPIIQYPQDMCAMQEIIWNTRPDLVIETGVAHGGSLVLSASMLALLDMSDAIESGQSINPKISSRRVIGIDIDIRPHNRALIEAHPMSSRIELIESGSTEAALIERVAAMAKGYKRVMVCLDSNHTHDHVMAELSAYAPMATSGCYCVVFDTAVEDLPADTFPDRPWSPGNNPKTAVHQYLKEGGAKDFAIDTAMADKLQITVAPDGFLLRR